jgi:urease accessory protein
MRTGTAITTAPATITTTDMTTADAGHPVPERSAASLLQILWLASPALPVGGFSYSEGLEAAVDAGLVHDEASAAAWLTDQLHLGLARSDLAVAAQAIPAWRKQDLPRVRALNHWVLQTRETLEFRLQTEQMGRSLLEWARQLGELGAGVFEQLQAADLNPRARRPACATAWWAMPSAGPRTWCRPPSNRCRSARARASACSRGWRSRSPMRWTTPWP